MADGILNPIEQLEADFDFDVYTKQEVDALLDEKADKSDTYTKTETDALLNDKADADSVYTKTETDTLLSAKADKSTTLAGYGITDAYTKTQTDNLLNGKADADSVYTKQEIDTKIPSSVGSATKPVYVNGGVLTECTYELNKTVPANAVFTDTTYSAGNGLNLSGTSFSAKAGTNVTVDGNGINVNGSGVVASADSGLINGGTAYTELRPTLDGTWVKNAQTTAINLQKLEGGIEYLYAILSKQYDQLKKYINGNYYDYDTDTDSKYTKTVPQGAMPYASLDSVGGKTVVMNQLVQNGNFSNGNYWNAELGTKSVSNNELTYTITTVGVNYYNNQVVQRYFNVPTDHVIFLHVETYTPNSNGFYMSVRTNSVGQSGVGLANVTPTPNTWNAFSKVSRTINTITDIAFYWNMNTNYAVGDSVKLRNCFVIDLTLMFGAGNEPSTVEEFESMFPASYYPYNAGTLLSAGVTEVVSNHANLINPANYYPTNVDVNGILTTRSYGGNYGDLYTASNGQTTAVPLEYISKLPYLVAGTYTLAVDEADAYIRVYTVDNAGNVSDYIAEMQQGTNKSATFTLASNTHITLRKLAGGVSVFKYLRLTKSGSALPYSPYGTIATYPIPAAIRNLEGYGWSAGSVYNYVDFERKVFVQNVGRVDLGSDYLNWTQHGTYTDVFYNNDSITDKKVGANLICPKYTINGTFANYANITNVGIYASSVTAGRIAVKDPTYANATALKTALNGVYLYYELATPIETDISAYLTDDNLISVEAGGTLTFPNSNGDDYRIAVPSQETYMVDLQSAI